MNDEDVIFAGSGGESPAVTIWEHPGSGSSVGRVSSFGRGYSVYCLVVSPSGGRLAAGTRAGMLRVHALEGFRPGENPTTLLEVFHGRDLGCAVLGLAFVNEDLVASGGADGSIRLWEVSQKALQAEIDARCGGVMSLCSLGLLVLASVGRDGILRIWDLDTLEATFEGEPFDLPDPAALTSLAFDPATGLLIHPSRSGDLHVYDVEQDFSHRVVTTHKGGFCAVACGPDAIATAGVDDLTLKLWSPDLERCVGQTSLARPVVALSFSTSQSLVTIGRDGSGQAWQVPQLLPQGRITGKDLRTCTGLPAKLLAECRSLSHRQWRDEKLSRAHTLLAQATDDSRRQVLDIVDHLEAEGFSLEAGLLLAEAARTDKRLLWELASRLAVAEGLGTQKAAVPTLYAIGGLLAEMKEPDMAREYFQKVAELESGYKDAKERMDRLAGHPLAGAAPEACLRADLGRGQFIEQEIEKHTVLNKKFIWRVVFDSQPGGAEASGLDAQELLASVRQELSDQGRAEQAGLVQAQLVLDRDRRPGHWVWISHADTLPALAYVLEIASGPRASGSSSHAVFDPQCLMSPQTTTVPEHNRQAKEACQHLRDSSTTKEWLGQMRGLVLRGIKRIRAQQDDGW